MNTAFINGLNVIYLTSCAVCGVTPDEENVSKMDLEAVYAQAKRHKMLSVTCMALKPYWEKTDAKLMSKWRMSINRTVKNSLLYTVEREKLYRFMDENEISYLPLKGIVLQDIYPALGMREMVDNDILIDINKRHLVRDYMLKNGYKSEGYGKDMHDVYIKPPIFNFEIHVYLAMESVNEVFYNYYLNIWDRLERPREDRSEFRFTKEDFYIHILVHAYKHFNYTGGVGLKPLADIFVYQQKYGDVLNREYLDTELKKLGLTVFEKNIRTLSEKTFGLDTAKGKRIEESLTDEERILLAFLIDSGSFGKKDVLFRSMIERFANGDGDITQKSKVKYLLNRLFPTGAYVRENYPFFHRYKILLPVMWVYRFFSKIFIKFGHVIKEVSFIIKQK